MVKNINEYVAKYFITTKKILEGVDNKNIVVLQFFQRADNVLLAGMNEVLELLEKNTDTSKYKIRYLPEGTIINNKEVVLELEGVWQDFGIYEGMIDGILAHSSSIATNAYHCVQAAKNKQIIFMGDRADHYSMHKIDGKAVKLAGVEIVSTDAQDVDKNDSSFGSMPHLFIQNFDGSLREACLAYKKVFPEEKIIALVDYHNDVITQSLEAYEALGENFAGVRVDTSANMRDHMFDNEPVSQDQYGVNPEQIIRLRKALDEAGAKDAIIVVSSGLNAEKIKWFEDNNAPVDMYGVGGSILRIWVNFSADATLLNGHKQAKEGRGYRPNDKLITYVKK
ncbi:nicotinate phosphoribosyltransferase [Mycoplasmopsis opalescens]|uniref:nicotinate phosphoribosyltransferase n=1 Tax=Mycoplasmopsis opalescens TaxID=114886 RepID=UPI0004A7412D|nr:nicotinate phosphoribosyltransferase [Mycoplasmopsis opalescens]